MFQTLVQMVDERAMAMPGCTAQLAKNEKKVFTPVSFKELQTEYRAFALSLMSLGVKRGDVVALISDNRQEWLVADLAVLALGAADSPRGRDAMPYEVETIIGRTHAKVAIAENKDQRDKILALLPRLPELETIIMIDGNAVEAPARILEYKDLLREGLEKLKSEDGLRLIEQEIAKGQAMDTATVIFTSGTTGNPRGAMITHRGMLYQCQELTKWIEWVPGWIWLSVLPVWHAFERIIQYLSLYELSTLAYSKPIGKVLMTDIQQLNPQLLCSVPRIWETVKAGVYQTLRKKPRLEQGLFAFFLQAAKRYRSLDNLLHDLKPQFTKPSKAHKALCFIPWLLLRPLHALGDRLVFSGIRNKFGTSFIAGISGGGALGKDINEFFSAIGIHILNGYGLTETGPVISLAGYPSQMEDGFMIVFDGTETKIIDPETGNELGAGQKGELLVRGPQVMKGYWEDEEKTAQAIDKDGFFHTGDIAVLDRNGRLAITGRVKDTIVLSGGENVEPVPIEDALKESEFIEQAVVLGQDKKQLGALIVLSAKNLELYLKNNHIPYVNRASLTEMPEVRQLINSEVSRLVSYRRGFKSFEQISRFVLLEKSFETGRELSAKQEVKRAEINKLYKSEIDLLFKP